MMESLRKEFIHPSAEFTPVPFWFWNDRLTKEEITRQIHDFRDKGVMGFVIHPRVGIPKDIPYLSDLFMDLVQTAVAEARRLGMTVILYDEAMYPSGAAKGLVVKDNPEYASRGLRMIEYPCTGKTNVDILLEEGEVLVSAKAVQKVSEQEINLHSTVILDYSANSVQFAPPNKKLWSILLFIETYSNGHIRGIHFGEDDGEPDAPLSADLLNPEAVQKFIRITHESYYKRLQSYFGNTIQAIFTDEPEILGRGARKGLKPWTRDFLTWYLQKENEERHLPALWFQAGPETDMIRKKYRKAVYQRLTNSYYKQLNDWCQKHGIALTGHPAASDEIGLLDYFQIPGQDVVWRWVAPEDGKALEGVHSTAGKCSSDAARHRGRRRNLNEFLGVCGKEGGWNLSAGDMKWYMDWLLVRGVNLLCPHAFYYSIDGERRINERPPDVGPNNIWWPFYDRFSSYMKRLSWLMTDSCNVTPIAVLCEEDHLPWKIVLPLYQNQIEFNYLEEHLFTAACSMENGRIAIQNQIYSVLIVENGARLEEETLRKLRRFVQEGGQVIDYAPEAGLDNWPGIKRIENEWEVVAALDCCIPRDLKLIPAAHYIRVSHVVKDGLHFYLLVNEGEEFYQGNLQLNISGKVEKWDPWEGTIVEQEIASVSADFQIPIRLERRASVVLCLDPAQAPAAAGKPKQVIKIGEMDLSGGWILTGGPFSLDADDRLKSWTEWKDEEHFSGTVTYENHFTIDQLESLQSVELDLGCVHEIAQVWINGEEAGVKMWAPYVWEIRPYLLEGNNRIQVAVTNSLANRIDRLSLPSGLLGPVQLSLVIAETAACK